MKKLIKITAVVAAIFVVLIIAALLTLKIIFPAEKLQAMTQDYAQKTLQREVTFSNVSFNLIGVTIKDLAISEAHTFEQGTFLKADHAILKVALKPLLKKRIEITTIGLKGLEVNTRRNEDGTFNFDDLMALSNTAEEDKTKDEEKENTSSSGSFFAVLADHIYAKNCHLYYEDIPNQLTASVTDLNLDIVDFDLDEPFNAKLKFTASYKDTEREISLPITSTLTIYLADLDNTAAYVTLQNLSATYHNIEVAIKGGIKNFNQPILNLQGTLSGLSSTALAEVMPDMPHFKLPPLTFNTDASLDLDASSAQLTQAKLSVGDSYLTATGKTNWGGKETTYQANTNLNLNLTQLATMTQLLDGFGMGGAITGQVAATDKNNGQDVQGNISFDQVTVAYAPVQITELKGDILLTSLANISSKNITGNLNENPFTASFAYKDLGEVMDIVFDADLSKLTLDTFTASEDSTSTSTAAHTTATDSPKSTEPESLFNLRSHIKIGEISVPYFTSTGATLETNLQKASASMKKANGTVNFTLQEGAIKDLELVMKDHKILRVLMLPFGIVNKVTSTLGINLFPTESGKIKFSSGSGTYKFTDGLMNIEETHFNSSLSNLTATGTINFHTEALDMNVKASVLTSQTPVVIKIGGTMSEPSGKLNLAQTAVSLVTGLVNYKTPGAVASGTVNMATGVTKSVANTGADAVKSTVGTAASAVKSLGGLFKSSKSKKDKETTPETEQPAN